MQSSQTNSSWKLFKQLLADYRHFSYCHQLHFTGSDKRPHGCSGTQDWCGLDYLRQLCSAVGGRHPVCRYYAGRSSCYFYQEISPRTVW